MREGPKYKGEWAFVGDAYDALPERLKREINQTFWREGHQGGDLEALYHVMKRHGHDFGADDPENREPRPVMGAGAEEYEEVMVIQELGEGL